MNDNLRNILFSSNDPLKAIEDFQEYNIIFIGVQNFFFQRANCFYLPSIQPLLPLLDLHMIPRLDFHTSILERLGEKLIQQINDIDKCNKVKERDMILNELLNRSFGLIRVKVMTPVVMAILKNMKHIDDKYLRIIVKDRELYYQCDVEVKRHIWLNNHRLFGDEVSPLLSQYIRIKDAIISADHQSQNNVFFATLPKNRRQEEVVQRLAFMIGKSVKLYNIVLEFLRTLFLRTKNVHYCTLRAELLMALHDLDIQEIISIDRCHTFTWCLEACMREKQVNAKKSHELQTFLDNIERGHEQILRDVSMIISDPHSINILASSVIKNLVQCISAEQLPRENQNIILLLRMLKLGLNSWEIITKQDIKEFKFDIQLLTKFLPALTSLLVDDQARFLNLRLPTNAVVDHEDSVPKIIEAYIQKSSVAAILAIHYALHVAKHKDRNGLIRILTILSLCKDDCAYEDFYLHSLVAVLIPMSDEFSNEEFCTALFDGFLFPGLNIDNVRKHIMKLLWHVHVKINKIRLNTILNVIEPRYANELYEALIAKCYSVRDFMLMETM